MNSPTVSVIIPVYNMEQYLEECVDSVINQTYGDLEIILIDDGSTDGSGALCEKLAENDHRIVVYHKPNGGLSSARNYGLTKASGKYISFIDSDDYILPDMIGKLVSGFSNNDIGLTACNYTFLYESGKQKPHRVMFPSDLRLSAEDAIRCLLFEKSYRCYAWNKLYKRELFDNIKFPEGKLYEDIITSYSLIQISGGIMYINDALYMYRQRNGSITHRSDKGVYEMLEPVREILQNERDNPDICTGALLYYKYVLFELIKVGAWDAYIYSEFKELYRNTKEHLRKCRAVSFKDKSALIILNLNKEICTFIYKSFCALRRW